MPVVPEQKAVQEPTIFDVPAEPQKPEPTPEPVAPKIPEFRVSKEIEDFYADIPKTPQPPLGGAQRESQLADKPIISINTEALKEKMHIAQEQLVKWGGIIKEQLPEKEQVVRFGKNLMQWGKKQYEKIMKKVNRK